MLSSFLCSKIIKEVKKFIKEELIMAGVDGIIVASSDEKRIGTFHEGAQKCAKEQRTFLIYKEDEKKLQGVKNGINLPVFFFDQVIGVIGITGDPEKIQPYGELFRKMTELLVQESYYLEQMQWRSRGLESFVYDWLNEKTISPELQQRARLLHIDLEKKKQFILMEGDFTYKSAVELARYWDDPGGLDFFVYRGPQRILLVHSITNEKSSVRYRLKKLHDCFSSLRTGVGQPVFPNDAAVGYHQAEKALSIASPGIFIFEQEMKLDLCLYDIASDTKTDFINRILKGISQDKELIYTFKTYFQHNMSLKQTAETLNIHINTLHYRMKKLENVTGLDIRASEDAVSLYLALRFLDETIKKTH